MAPSVQKITLSRSRDIPFHKLVLSQANVRRVKADVSVEELAEDIARRGLLQSLNVRPVLDAGGNETGMFEIPAGGRRYQALALLVKRKRLLKTTPVPCVVRDAETTILAEDDSLAENTQRVPLHPLDQFRAFLRLREKGMTEEEIAAAFFTTAQVVRQRLRLVSVSPALLDVYAEDGMTLDMLMAFTVNPDHARQEQVWEAVGNTGRNEPWHIRRLLTETTVRASDKRAVFVGLEAYEVAGGIIMRDLFQVDDGGWLEDAALLDRLVVEKLKVLADKIAEEGWKWVEAAVSFPYGVANGLRALYGSPVDLSADEQATIEALKAEYAKLEAEYEGAEELPDAVDARLGEIETALARFDDRPLRYDPAAIARAGVFVSIDTDGSLLIDRGHVRPADESPAEPEGSETPEADGADGDPGVPAVQRAVITVGGQPTEPEEEEEGIRPLPERLVMELTAHRTLTLRDAVALNPHVALTLLLHKLVSDTFQHRSMTGCLEAGVRHVFFPAQADDLKDSLSAKTIAERQEAWKQDIPAEDDALWDWLDRLDETSRMALLAHCVSFGVNALHEKPNTYGGNGVSAHGLKVRLAQADRLAQATGLDMVEAGWRPTFGNYLSRVSKPRILEAVREGAGARAAELIGHLKKADMAKEAERLLADTGWLPEPLRLGDQAQPADVPAGEADLEALPAFLAGDDEENPVAPVTGGDREHLSAAE
ncbi:ParB/RepB/Spo0J family partition protein [Xanthobacter autotrophicus]|uniref:ParB/RepB/Spo0J family partition protein n=1 Tax=Xanthobacter autotrophicus TaxID=280 RepID=UPI0037263FC9